MFFYYQQAGGEEVWQEALAVQRTAIQASRKPRYVTVLDVSSLVDDTTTKEEMMALKYAGPMYFDWDSKDIDDCITRVQKFIKKLEDMEVDLGSIRFFASGGKGFHCEIPQEVFMAKAQPKGIQGLPNIYKEMAYSLYVDTMDLRVYSARKGRMWRTPNVERENGRYKVPVTAQEIKNMTEESYVEFTQAPRKSIETTTPTMNEKLAVMYLKSEQKVINAAKKRGSAQKDVEALAKFKGVYPATIKRIMDGEATVEGAGFNKIAMQLGITVNGLGKTEDEYIADCAGLIAKHSSDGNRYNTPQRREQELRRMFDYTQDNVCYSYSVGAIKTLLKPGEATPDLDGMTADTHGTVINDSDEESDESIYGGVFITEKGAYKKSEEGISQICDIAFSDIQLLMDMGDNSLNGYEADVLFKGGLKGRRRIGLEVLQSKTKFGSFSMVNSGIFTGSDNQVQCLSGRLRDRALKNNNVVNLVHKEGLDILRRNTSDGPTTEIIWVSHDNVKTMTDMKYRYQSRLNASAMYKSDVYESDKYVGSAENAAVVEALLNLNKPYVIGNLLGWMTSCFHRQIYHLNENQFPICQVFGQAGSGKSSTVQAMMHMFYYLSPPKITSASGATKFTLESYMQGSASIPCVLDEYKPRQFSPAKRGELLTLFREAYNANTFGKGGGSGPDAKWNDVQQHTYSAPLLFIGEAIESETAVLERSISIALDKGGLTGRGKNIQIVRDNRHVLSSLGREIIDSTFAIGDLGNFKTYFHKLHDEVVEELGHNGNDRPLFNLAVVLNGLAFFKRILSNYHGSMFDEKMDHLAASVRDLSLHAGIVVTSEAAKVIGTLAFMSRTEIGSSDIGLELTEDYFIDAKFVDLKIRNVYIKYSTWCHRKGQEPLYDNEDAFTQGLAGFVAVVDKFTATSPLKESALTKVFRLDRALLEKEGVETFR